MSGTQRLSASRKTLESRIINMILVWQYTTSPMSSGKLEDSRHLLRFTDCILLIANSQVISSSRKHPQGSGYLWSQHYGAWWHCAWASYATLPALLLYAACLVFLKADYCLGWYCICPSFTDEVIWPCVLVFFTQQHRYLVLLEVIKTLFLLNWLILSW